jgi:hypothetical protein
VRTIWQLELLNLVQRELKVLSPVENGGAFRGKVAARGIGDRKGWALGELGIGIGSGPGEA